MDLLFREKWWWRTDTDPKGGGHRVWQMIYWYSFDTKKATPIQQLKHSFVWFVLGILASLASALF